MKKLIITALVACTTTMLQAATISWNSGVLKGLNTSEGGWGSTTITSGSVAAYLFVLSNQEAYDKLYSANAKTLSSNVYAAYKDNLSSAAASKNTGTSIILNDGNSTYTTGSRQYAALLYILTDGDKTYYIGNVGDSGELKSASNVIKSNMATKIGSTGADMTSVGWQPVPEPTSAMLLLLGMAGLMLKRKRA